jgi:hypothetical protein
MIHPKGSGFLEFLGKPRPPFGVVQEGDVNPSHTVLLIRVEE